MPHDVNDLPEWSRDWAQKRLAQHVLLPDNTRVGISAEDWQGLRDWLVVLPAERPKMQDKLWKVTLVQALDAQQRWHAEMATRSARIAAKRGTFAGDANAVETVVAALDAAGNPGWRWVRVLTPEGLDYEGNAMGHCVGQGGYDDGNTIFSLRDPNNLPHCTVEWNEAGRVVKQVQGRANQSVVERYHGAVGAFLKGLKPKTVKSAHNFGHFMNDGELLHWSGLTEGMHIKGSLRLDNCLGLTALPEGLHVEGSLDLNGCTGLTTLPDGLYVEGYLYLRRCTGLTTLPKGLHVGESLYLNDCAVLTALPEGLHVGGSLDLGGCIDLTALPKGLHVKENLRLNGCTGLTTLPKGLHVKGNLHLGGCIGLTTLSEDLKVDGSLDFEGCTGLTTLPEGLRVAESLYLNGCKGLMALPAGLHVEGNLDLRSCTGLTALPEGLHVEGNLDLRGCTGLTTLPAGLHVEGRIRGGEHLHRQAVTLSM